MKILVIEPKATPYVKDIPSDLESMQSIVNGYIEAIYPFNDDVALVCNEEGKILGLEPNRIVNYDVICGTFFIVGLGEEDFISLTDAQITEYTKMFSIQ